MNNLSKRIRKQKKRIQPTLEDQENKPDDFELFSASLANISPDLDEKQFNDIVSGENIYQLIINLKNSNQIVNNCLFAIQNILKISNRFGDRVMKTFQTLNLITHLIEIPINEQIITPYLMVAIEIFETWSIDALNIYYQHILLVLDNVLNKSLNADVIIEALNLIQVLTEIIPQFPFQQFQATFQSIYLLEHPSLQKLNFAQQQRIKSLTLISFLNIGYNDDPKIAQFVNQSISMDIFDQLRNFETFILVQYIEEEMDVDQPKDERLELALSIWENSAQAIIQVLYYLGRIYEYDYDGKQQNKKLYPNKQNAPQFFQQNVITQLQQQIINYFINYQQIQQAKVLTSSTTYTEQLVETSLLILSTALIVSQNLASLQAPQITPILLQQIESLYLNSIFHAEDKIQLINEYLKLLVQVLSNDEKQILQVPELFLINLGNELQEEESLFILVELMKLRYSSKIINTIDIIQKVTLFLLNIMNNKQIMLAAEALDCLFDVYTEEDYNQLLVSMNMIPILKQGYQGLKQSIPKSKDDKEFLMLTLENLGQFIEYKVKLL
ncbi:hypothetical protein pb186bvf_001535 [Paramecium bursaria]